MSVPKSVAPAVVTTGLTCFLVLVGPIIGGAEDICVSSPSDLVDALAWAAGNGEYDVIQVVQDTYPTPGGPFTYLAMQAEPGLEVLGGFTPGCASRVLDPTNTILDGQSSNTVVEIIPDDGSGGDLLFEGFTVRNGNGPSFNPGGLQIGISTGFWGSVTVAFNIISGNHSATGTGGLFAGSDTGLTRIENNLIVGNTSASGWGGAHIVCNGPELFVTNNTVADNTGPNAGGMRLSGSQIPAWVTNTIAWGNTVWDLDLGPMVPVLAHNDVGALWGTPDPASVNNLSVDPLFAGGGDYHLVHNSPAINVGSNFPVGGLPAQDIEGAPRIQGTVVDMGAYESPVLFVDDFESGDTSSWSATFPGD